MDRPPAAAESTAFRPLVRPGGRRIPAQVWDAAVEARRIRDTAARDAADIVARAQDEARALHAASVARGREEGLAAAAGVLADAAAGRDRILAAAEGELVELAFEIARRVLPGIVERDRGAVVEVAARALAAARACPPVTLRATGADLAALREAEPRLAAQAGQVVRLVQDDSMARGGVILETETCRVDARLETQLELLRRALGARDGAQGGSR